MRSLNKLSTCLGVLIAVVLFGCSKNDFEPGETYSVKMSNDWYVNLYDEGSTDGYLAKPTAFHTYNTSYDQDSLWLDDDGNIWEFKIKARADFQGMTFSTTSSQNEYYNITVKVTEGKIMSKATTTAAGNITDSIFMKVVFSDDPTSVYEIRGYGRTKFKEDEP